MFGSSITHWYGPPHRDLPTTQVSWSDAAIQPTDDAVFVDSTFEGNAVPCNSFYVPGWHSSALYIRGPWKVVIVSCAFRNNEGPVAPESWNGAWNNNYASKGAVYVEAGGPINIVRTLFQGNKGVKGGE